MNRCILFTLLTCCFAFTIAKELEIVKDDEFLKTIQSESYVVALFSKPNCKLCNEFEKELAVSRDELVDSLDATVVKLVSSPLVKLYSPTLEPAVVFFRHGVPLLYHGPANEEEILAVFNRCKDPSVKALNDDTFEHLTQAATGATTGDWLVLFQKNTCVKSQRLQAVLEATACQLKQKMNVARVDKSSDGAATARRFSISETPTFVLFRHGKMYKYALDTMTMQNLVDFATDFYRNSKGQPVPVPKSPFDDFTEMIVEKMRENPQVVKIGSIVISISIILFIIVKFLGKKSGEKSKNKDSKKKS